MPRQPRQIRLDRLWGSSSAKTPDAEIAASSIAHKVDVQGAKKEVQEIEEKELQGQAFVKNGSRDRFGQVRKNPGGRPKKVVLAGVAPPPKASNRKVPGAQRAEFGAREKLQMIKVVRQVQAAIHVKYAGESEQVRHKLMLAAVQSSIKFSGRVFFYILMGL